MTPDRIQKKVILRAPRERVWKALSDADAFQSWFGVRFDGRFTPGATLRGVIVGTQVDAESAEAMKEYQGRSFVVTIEQMEPGRLFSYRWHPHAIEPGVEYDAEPTTLVTFELEDAAAGTLLTVTESGFDGIPLSRRAKAFEANSGGWDAQVILLGKYLDRGV